ncbi:C10 family peptidase [Odoribacter sp. OttesenSCG-928-J03]|nr:C10 family peptidase [Odoribacter sp. OttesenSCG-928-J03]
MKKLIFPTIIISIFVALILSCSDKNENDFISSVEQSTEYDNALNLLTEFINTYELPTRNNTNITFNITNVIQEEIKIPNELKEIATRSSNSVQTETVNIYRFDFENNGEKGFAISVGDKRINTMLCYVEKGSIEDTLYNESMAEYISNLKYFIYNKLEQIDFPSIETRATAIQVSKGPIMNLAWAQGWPYNINCPIKNCSKNNGMALVGCPGVAVMQSLAFMSPQMIKNWHPNVIQYRTQKTISSTYSDLHGFGNYVRWIADGVGTSYGCDKSSSDMGKVSKFLSKYNVSYHHKSSNNMHLGKAVYTIHTHNCPIICRGMRHKKSGGHQWVIEGHRGWMYSGINYDVVKGQTQYWYCNWGWGGSGNGWYVGYMTPRWSGDDSGTEMSGTYHNNNDFIYLGWYTWYH